jgi:hypothetical protein
MEQRKDYVESQIEMLSKALRRLLEKILNIKTEDNLRENEQEIFSQEITLVDKLSIEAILKIEDTDLIKTLQEKYGFSNAQLKIVGDILFEYSGKINSNKNICTKAKILYQYCQANELKIIDFTVLSRLTALEMQLKAFQN